MQEVGQVDISYNRLWKLLIDKGIKKTQLKTLAGVSTNVIAKLGKNEPVSMETQTAMLPAEEHNDRMSLAYKMGKY